jgi:hypothetical protein
MPPKKRTGGFQPKVPVRLNCVETGDEGVVVVPEEVSVRRRMGGGHRATGAGRRGMGRRGRRGGGGGRRGAGAANGEEGLHAGEALFDWAERQYYVLQCEAEDGDPVSVDKDVRLRYEVIMLSASRNDDDDDDDDDDFVGGGG